MCNRVDDPAPPGSFVDVLPLTAIFDSPDHSGLYMAVGLIVSAMS
jgi:hypothetical protein